MTEDIFTDEDLSNAERCSSLGPHYFSSRRFAEEIMKDAETTTFADILKRVSDELYSVMLEKTENFLLSDVESNVQSHIWRTVDEVVKGILSGEKWIMDRYALGSKYDCAAAREAIARHVPKELQDARIRDLEEEVKNLKDRLSWATR